ncbi:MAG TPA: hypothetical protein EYO84_08270 [Planctomycetes bacterium]|nr:hypothetical protein [Planctomycetota bacterium]
MLSDTAGSLAWRVVERFYCARQVFSSVHDRYEQIVHSYVEKFDQPREEIRLAPRELVELLSTQDLEKLRDQYLMPLKQACHRLFRTEVSTDFLDRLVNDIFHELSILKEEHYNVLTYDVDDAARNSDPERDLQLEQKAVLDEVHNMFPQKVHRIAHLFDVGTSALEALLHRWKQDPVLIRSLFLQRDQFVKESYEDGLCHFYRLMYGEQNAWQGYRIVGDSFLASGFVSHAHVAYSEGLESLSRSDLAGPEKESAVTGFQSSIADMQQAMASSSAEQPEEKR